MSQGIYGISSRWKQEYGLLIIVKFGEGRKPMVFRDANGGEIIFYKAAFPVPFLVPISSP